MSESGHDFWTQAAQEARIARIARMLPNEGELTCQMIGEVVETAQQYLAEFAISQVALARGLGTNQSYISDLFNHGGRNMPADVRDKLVRKLNAWLEEDFRGRMVRKPDNFVELRSATLIIEAARNVKAARTIGVVTGPAGLGKSMTAKYLAANGDDKLAGTMLVTVDHDARTARGLLDKIYDASRLRRNRLKHPTLAAVIERLKDSGRLLIIDQAHDLGTNTSAYKLIMDLHDACELPILLLGTKAIHDQLTDDVDPNFGQLSSRIGLRVHLLSELFKHGPTGRRLQWVSTDELRRIVERGKVRLHPDALRALLDVANFQVGFLRRVKWVLFYAAAIARGAKSPLILLAHVEKAAGMVKGEKCKLALAEESVPAEAVTA